jgi:hypothetical protein
MTFAAGCGGQMYRPKPVMDLDPLQEIDDEDIRKAFEAKPQMPDNVTVAYYTAGTHDERSFGQQVSGEPGKAGSNNDSRLETMLWRLPGVDGIYRIPAIAVSGERRYEPGNPYAGTPPLSVKKLRLLAARAHADVLVIFDHGRNEGGINGLFGLSALIIPIFFVPMIDSRVESYVSAYVIDVRNGYLYGQVDVDELVGDEFATIYDTESSEEALAQWERLLERLGGDLSKLFEAERARHADALATSKSR